MENKVYFHPMSVQSPNFITLIDEMIEDLNVRGTNAHLLKCEGQIRFCQSNLNGSKSACKFCVNTFDTILGNLNINHKLTISSLTISEENSREIEEFMQNSFQHINSFDDLKKLTYKGINLGYGIVSTYVSETRNNTWETISHRIIKNLVRGALNSLLAFENTVEKISVTEIVLYNGRYHDNKPILNFAVKNAIHFKVLETIGGRVRQKYKKHIFPNSTPHSIINYTQNIINNWETSKLSETEKIRRGSEFFENRAKGLAVADKSYTKNQNNNDLRFVDNTKKKLVIYNSSPDELFSLGEEWEWSFEGKSDQASVIEYLCSRLRNKNIQIILRCHPNLATYKGVELEQYINIEKEFDNFVYIPPSSRINTYTLLNEADYVLAFGSTIGIEAAYWGKKSILIGTSFYQNLDAVYKVNNFQQLEALLMDSKNSNGLQRKRQATRYGFFMIEKLYNIKPFFKLTPTQPQLDGLMYYSLIKNIRLLIRLKIFLNVIMNRAFSKL